MAIKILKKGIKKKLCGKAICPNCTCEFIFEKEDTHYIQTGYNEGETIIDCPNCEERIVNGVKLDDVPDFLKIVDILKIQEYEKDD